MSKICFYSVPYLHIKSYYDLIDCSVEHGLSFLEGFNRFELSYPDIEAAKRIKKYADEKNVKFSCFSVFINVVGDDGNEMIEKLKGYAEVCAVLECPYLHHTVASEFRNSDSVLADREENYRKGLEAVGAVYDYAAKLGVKTVYEDQGYIFNGTENFARFLRDVKRDVGVVVDFGNIYQVGESIEPFVEAFADRVCHVHIKNVTVDDVNVANTGMKTLQNKYMYEAELDKGCVDCEKIVSMLKDKGYNGYYSLEFSADSDNSDYMKNCINKINSWIG